MYAYSVAKGILEDTDQVDFEEKLFKDREVVEGVNTNFDYWRKFNNLHGWMSRLYQTKGGKDDSFNTSYLRLMPEDLDQLEQDAQNKTNLDPTQGFFFGDAYPLTDEDAMEIIRFTAKAREIIADDGAIVYTSWW